MMASSTYKIYLFTLVILGCTVLRNGAMLDDQKILDDNYIKEKSNTDAAIIDETTPETFGNNEKNCSTYDNCEDCAKSNCTWVLCAAISAFMCENEAAEYCGKVDCSNITTTPVPTTTIPSNETTIAPTTTPEPPTTPPTTPPPTTPPTTVAPNTTTIAPNTTTVAPNTTTPATSTTSSPIPITTVAPHVRHFDAGSFVGGIILTLTVTAVSFAAWKFYRRRALSTSYTNF